MNKWMGLIIGTAVGVATSAVYLYLFAPARDTTFDENYQSRLDWALAEGRKAGKERELELRNELQQARLNPPIPKEEPPVSLPTTKDDEDKSDGTKK